MVHQLYSSKCSADRREKMMRGILVGEVLTERMIFRLSFAGAMAILVPDGSENESQPGALGEGAQQRCPALSEQRLSQSISKSPSIAATAAACRSPIHAA